MSKFLAKFKSTEVQSIVNNTKFKVATFSGTALVAFQTVAHAVDAGADPISSMTTTFGTVSTICLNGIAAVAPVAITIFGAMFAWKKGIKFFKELTQG